MAVKQIVDSSATTPKVEQLYMQNQIALQKLIEQQLSGQASPSAI